MVRIAIHLNTTMNSRRGDDPSPIEQRLNLFGVADSSLPVRNRHRETEHFDPLEKSQCFL
jgi:hypothetical protein